MASILKTDKIEGVTSSGTVQMPAGHVIQTVITASSSDIDTTSSSFVATGLIVSITPKFSNSKIIVTLTGGVQTRDTSGMTGRTDLYRQLTGGSYTSVVMLSNNTLASTYGIGHSSQYIDTSHSTTNAINYQPYFKTTAGTYWFNYDTTINLIAQEIAQ